MPTQREAPASRRDRRRLWGTVAATVGLLGAVAPARAEGPDGAEFFEKEVRPILVERCGECHGATGTAKGGLRLVSRESLLKGGDSGPAVVAGKPGESLLVEAIRYVDEPKMPPAGKLPAREIEVLNRWVARGAPWPDAPAARSPAAPTDARPAFAVTDEQRRFWSFRPLSDPPPPAVKDAAWPRSDLDRFILAGLEARGLRPAPPADRRAFIRRASFDLTGLPPSPEDVERFVADTSPGAFATLIDGLLASPHYGERWGRHWLDLVRYTDSFDARIAGTGSELDVNDSWRYRDWVVDAFNRDLPYDRFVRAQVAGDLLPEDDPSGGGTVATGLLAIGNWGGGDSDKEKLLTDIADDQVDVVSRAFMGLTVACARCHDHKFDPISTKDYYGLAGIFFSTHILPNVGPKTNLPPMLRIPIDTTAEKARRAGYAGRVKALEAESAGRLEAARAELVRALRPETARYVLAARELSQEPAGGASLGAFAASRGLRPYALRQWSAALGFRADDALLSNRMTNFLGNPGVSGWRGATGQPSALVNANAEAVSLLSFRLPGRSVSVHPGPEDGVAVAWSSPLAGTFLVSGGLADADRAAGDGVSWSLDLESGGRLRPLARGGFVNGGAQDLKDGAGGRPLGALRLSPGDLVRLTVYPKGEYSCDMTHVRLLVRSEDGAGAWDLSADLAEYPNEANPHPDRAGRKGVWRFVEVRKAAPGPPAPGLDAVVKVIDDPKAGREALAAAAEAMRGVYDRADASNPFWVRRAADEAELADEARQTLARLRGELAALQKNPPPPPRFANGASEGGVPGSPHEGVHDVRVHVRGSYSRLGEMVPRHFPVVLAGETPPAIRSGSGRKELARWLTEARHPLTARVMANRVWQHHFGAGIVRTPGNFGKLGERPTHPELLDHLARLFVDGGWSVKSLHRAVMLSAAYRQSAEAAPATFQADPDNRLFGRMNRRRVDAESVRDGLLSAAGSLDPALGGPPTRDAKTRRRALYLMTIRSDRSSFGPLFDAADPTAMVDTRTVSTVAPQALFLMNNAFVIDQARALARRLEAERPEGGDARVGRAYALLFGRPPTDDERRVAREALAEFARAGGGASAWPAYCHVLLCSNEWVYTD